MAILQSNLRRLIAARAAGLAGFLAIASCLGYGQAVNSCLDCHSAQPGKLEVTPDKFSQDIHAQKGFTVSDAKVAAHDFTVTAVSGEPITLLENAQVDQK